MLCCFRVPTTSVGARSEGSPQLSSLTPSSFPSPLSIPGSLKPSWDLRKPPACSPYFQLAPLTPSWLPLLPEHPWVSGTFLGPQEAPSTLPAHSPCSQSIPGSLEPSWSLRKPPAHSQLAPLAPRASLGPWSELGARGASWSKGSKLGANWKAPSLLPSLPARSPHSSSLPMGNEQFSMYWGPHHLWGARG